MSISRNARTGLGLTILTIGMIVSLLMSAHTSPALAESHIEISPDTSNTFWQGQAWVTSYNDEGGYQDIAYVAFGDEFGYGTELSSLVGHVVDNSIKSYVLNWRPNHLGNNFQLCGLRVAYRLPLEGGGFDSLFSYIHVAGSVMLPRNSSSEWANDWSGGCIYQTAGSPNNVYNIHLNIPNGSRIDYLRVYYYGKPIIIYLPLIIKNN